MGSFRNSFLELMRFSDISSFSVRRTGIVYNVTPSAVGVIVHKVVGNRYIEKRVNLRVEHVRHSKCRQEFLDRVKANHEARLPAQERGGEFNLYSDCKIDDLMDFGYLAPLRRKPNLPREAHTVSGAGNPPQTIVPVAYETTI
jgi:large subunit ribosomal protein L21e